MAASISSSALAPHGSLRASLIAKRQQISSWLAKRRAANVA